VGLGSHVLEPSVGIPARSTIERQGIQVTVKKALLVELTILDARLVYVHSWTDSMVENGNIIMYRKCVVTTSGERQVSDGFVMWCYVPAACLPRRETT
jgi:hypothetical protein